MQIPQSLAADVTCDGKVDTLRARVKKTAAGQRIFEVLVVDASGGQLRAQGVEFAYASMDGTLVENQFELCALPWQPSPRVKIREFSRQEAQTLTGIAGVCHMAMIIDDGHCDAIALFWAPSLESGHNLVVVRN